MHGRELWKSDGTAAGTVMVKDIRPGTRMWVRHRLGALTDVEGTLYFAANDGATRSGTLEERRDRGRDRHGEGHHARLQRAHRHGTSPIVGGTLYFAADDGTHGDELWKSDGTEAGTVMVKDIDPG